MSKLRVLLVTSMPWREDNNIGNSYSNLFGDLDDFDFAHVYCREGMPYNKKCKKYFQITEGRLVRNWFHPSSPTGYSFEMDASYMVNQPGIANSKAYDKARILRWELFFMARDLIWALGRWKSKQLYSFVEDFEPDLIFATLTYMPNINKMLVNLHKKYNLPLILYSWDDVYSMHNFSYNPLFWIRKFYQRYYIRKSVACCKLLYVITTEMKEEYSQYFHKECRILYKGYDFDIVPELKEKVCRPYKLVFMGNIGAGRWKALAELAKVVYDINKEKQYATIDIYTLSPLSEKMIRALNIEGASSIKKNVPQEMVMQTQRNADILVHVEPNNKQDASFYRLSFSTKLVDYLFNARCILGLGYKTATLSYIERNGAGLVVTEEKILKQELLQLFKEPDSIIAYGKRAWECGVKNHKREYIREMLIRDFSQCALQ